MSLLPVGFGASGGDYEITDSLRIRNSASASLQRFNATETNRRTFTYSGWFKLGFLNNDLWFQSARYNTSNFTGITINVNQGFGIYQKDSNNITFVVREAGEKRDYAAWYHFVAAVDTTQSTSTNRVKLYVNGVLSTSLVSASYPSQNLETFFNTTTAVQTFAQSATTGNAQWDGYVTETHFIDGQQLTADDFGEFDANGTWKAKDYTGTYGTNGFYLPMKPTTQADGFNTVLYRASTTDGTYDIKGFGFNPDLIWIKNRDNVERHFLFDTVRGVDSSKALVSSDSSAEGTNGISGTTISTINDGFRIVESSINSGELYFNNRTYVAWGWDAGSGSAASNTNGSITSTVKANDATGFSIVTYSANGSTGTIGHGLSSAPEFIIVKKRNAAERWTVYHQNTSNAYIYLNETFAAETANANLRFGNNSSVVAPTSSVFTVGNSNDVNGSGGTYVAYCFSEVSGYSKIGSYTGNASTNGPVVTTGFRPAWIMTKAATGSSGWHITDTRRYPQNDTSTSMGWLDADSTAAEGDYRTYEVSDTGFQVLDNGSAVNGSGVTYIYMAFAETADAVFNFDASGNKNNFEPFNINSSGESETTYDLMKDTPSLVDENAGNFATLNPLYENSITTLSEANLKGSGTAGAQEIATIIANGTSNFYYEIDIVARASWMVVGLASVPVSGGLSGLTHPLADARFYRYELNSGATYNGGTYTASGGFTATAGDVIGIHYNNGTMTPYKNGIVQTPTMSLPTTSGVVPSIGADNASTTFVVNFGQRPFAYTPPTGSKKLNTFNLPDSTIEDGSDYFNPVLYSGNSSTQSITGVGFQPDLVWMKDRNSYVHVTAVDAVRGAPLDLFTSAQNGDSNDHNGLTAFTSDGFNLGSSTNHNVTGHSYVAWNWLAGNSTSTNTSGSVNSTVSVNTTAGFSIVGFTSPSSGSFTMGHGLGASPDLIIMKRRASTSNWGIFHSAVCTSEDNYFIFNSNALISYTDFWGAALPTSTVFGANVGASAIANEAMIAWCWRAIEGYSAFGKYTGNNSTDGPFVYTGFRPAYILVKSSSGASNNIQWNVYDTTRGTFNPIDEYTLVSTPDVESNSAATYYEADILSNGFKIRASGVYGVNQNNCIYAYAAFAENPFKNALAR